MLKTRVIERIARAFYDANLMGLKSFEAPEDEFEGEAILVVADCYRFDGNILWDKSGETDGALRSIIDNVFSVAFGPDCLDDATLSLIVARSRAIMLEEHAAYLTQFKGDVQ
jgi:hypothetical protein